MSRPDHNSLLSRVSNNLADLGTPTDHMLLTRWRILALAQYLLGSPSGEAERLATNALQIFAEEGPSAHLDDALQKAGDAIAQATSIRLGSVLPGIVPEVRADVFEQLNKYSACGESVIEEATAVLPTVRDRLRNPAAGAILAGIRHRFELVVNVLRDGNRDIEQRIRAGAAILYLNEIHDAIVDDLGHIGLLDDDFALRVVLDEIEATSNLDTLHWAERISALWDELPFLRGVRLRDDQGPIATTWLDRINSFLSYNQALNREIELLVLVQPSIACSPLHTIVTLMGLSVLDGLTSSYDSVQALEVGNHYEIDGKVRAQFKGLDQYRNDWLRLGLRGKGNLTHVVPPTVAKRMLPADPTKQLSSEREFARHNPAQDNEVIQKFFNWSEAIGAASVASRVLLVTTKQRALDLLGEVQSNGVSLLDNGLVCFSGLNPSMEVIRSALIIVVPNLRVVRDLIEEDAQSLAVIVDGYERLRRGRHDLPFLLSRTSPPPIIVWTVTGYYPDQTPSWLPDHQTFTIDAGDLSYILELDGDPNDAMALSRESLWEAATGGGIRRYPAPLAEDEKTVLATVDEFLRVVRDSEELPEYWKYHLYSSTTTLRALVSATASYWADIREFTRGWDEDFRNQWQQLRSHVAERLSSIDEAHQVVINAVEEVSAEVNTKASSLLSFWQDSAEGHWCVVCDRYAQLKVIDRFARKEGIDIEPVALRDLGVCKSCVAIGWRSQAFAKRLRAHTPKSLIAITNDQEWEKWERIQNHWHLSVGQSILEAIGHRPTQPTLPTHHLIEDDEPEWTFHAASVEDSIREVPCVFVWLADEPHCKVLAHDARVLVEVGDQAREKHAHNLISEDRVILSPGSGRWSPADEFTQSVVRVVEESNPQIVRDAREWRQALFKLTLSREWDLDEVRSQLADVGVERGPQTLAGWLDLDQAAPIGPKQIRRELSAIWRLVGDYTERPVDEVIHACESLRSLRRSAGRALLKLWKGRAVNLGIDDEWLRELIDQLRQEVQIHLVEGLSYGQVPDIMLGWWITPELAERFEIQEGYQMPRDDDTDSGEDDEGS